MLRLLQHFCFAFVFILSTTGASLPYTVVGDYDVTDENGLGRRFDGIGGLSGGGATSKLLVNYPPKQRDEILDYLFKPNFGASLQILKVEIGGDAQSTDGTEASHMHNSWEENYNRGYEWWLMKEAKKRNPDIKLCGLPWGFPGWLGFGDDSSPFSNVTALADYVIRWIQGAQRVHNLTIDCVGIWNERSYSISYIVTLRKMLDAAGLKATRIVASDGGWGIAGDMINNNALAQAVDYIGCHYPGTSTTVDALVTGKQLWASEDYSTFNDRTGGGCWARILNQNYVNGFMTSTISWNLIASYYNNLPFYRDGLMTAIEPWSGNYDVATPIWVSAHTTQFTQIGWRYLRHGAGSGHLEGGGSHVALTSPDNQHLTIIIETMTHDHSLCIRPGLKPYTVQNQTANFRLGGTFKSFTELNVWVSRLDPRSGEPSMFIQQSPIQAVGGVFRLELGLDEVYTLSTVNTARKGQYPPPPASKPFPLPYMDDFQSYAESQEPFNLAPQSGSFEVVEVAPNVKVMRQTVLQHPVSWCNAEDSNKTITIAGSPQWTDISVRVDFGLNTTGAADSARGVFLAAQVSSLGCGANKAVGVFFALDPGLNVYIITSDLAFTTEISRGVLPTTSQKMNTAQLTLRDNMVEVYYNGKLLDKVENPRGKQKGFVALGTTTWGTADFDNFAIMPVDQQHALFFRPHHT